VTIWGISDLHLSFARPDRRERFAARWRDHAATIEREWRAVVRPEDLVLLPGDLSMARTHREVQPDLAWLDKLPGTKVLAPGNHDTWWNRVEAVRRLLRRSLRAVDGDALATHGVIVCGARGAPASTDDDTAEAPDADDALGTLDRALEAARRLRTDREPIYVLWHFPPFDPFGRPGRAVSRFEAAEATACLYGHLHIAGQWSRAVQGYVRGVAYHCVAADAIGFRPLRIAVEDAPRHPVQPPRPDRVE
jgi:predicted phosphohydrolase